MDDKSNSVPLTQRAWWPVLLITITIVSGGLAGGVFTWYINRPKMAVLTYRTATTTLASPEAVALIPNLTVLIGAEKISSLYAHNIEISASDGPYLDEVNIVFTHSPFAHSYGLRTSAPSATQSIACTPAANILRCKMGPLSPKFPGDFRITVATDTEEAPRPSMTARNAELVASSAASSSGDTVERTLMGFGLGSSFAAALSLATQLVRKKG